VEEIWGDDVPANPTKAPQVVVSRARSATATDVIERTPRGYRLALTSPEAATARSVSGIRVMTSEWGAPVSPRLHAISRSFGG
jgi:hypothetical protein